MPNSGEAQPFSWKRAGMHVGIPLLLSLVAAAVVVATTDIDDPEKMGRETVLLLAPGLGLALLTSWLVQTRRIAYAWLFGVLAAFVFVGAVATPAIERLRSHPVALHSSDTLPLELVDIGGEPHFRHPYLMFSFKQPSPGFVESEEALRNVQDLIPEDRSVHTYALAETVPLPFIIVTLKKANRVDREQLEEYVAGLSSIKLRYGDNWSERENRVIWEPSFRGAKMHVALGETDHVRFYAYVDDFDTDAEYIVSLFGISLGEDTFADVFESFRSR